MQYPQNYNQNYQDSHSHFSRSQYPESFKVANIPKQKKYVHNNYRLVVKSEDRDRSIYRNPNDYKIILPRRYRNITAIECGLIMLPNFSNSEKYFTLEIQEICDGPYDSLDSNISNCLALIPNSLALNNYNYILSSPGDTSFVKNYIKKFVDTPLASLETLTIKFKKENKNIINFGQDLLPYDKEFSFTLTGLNNTFTALNINVGDDTLQINSPDHGLVNSDTINDAIILYDVQVKYFDSITNKNIVKIVKSLNTTILGNKRIPHVFTKDNFKIGVSEDLKNELSPSDNNSDGNKYYPNLVLTGKWKRVYRSDGNYSRVNIIDIQNIDNDKNIKITTGTNHNLSTNDRIYISKNNDADSSYLYNNYHIVIEKVAEDEFKINKNNIQISDILKEDDSDAVNDITDNPMLPEEAHLESDDIENTTISNNDIVNNPLGIYMQKYGNPDPSIQNMLIFNITTRDEDSEHVMSQNISYGNIIRN